MMDQELAGDCVYKGKGDTLESGSYRGIKLPDQIMKVFELVIETRLRNRVTIGNTQFGFSAGKGKSIQYSF